MVPLYLLMPKKWQPVVGITVTDSFAEMSPGPPFTNMVNFNPGMDK